MCTEMPNPPMLHITNFGQPCSINKFVPPLQTVRHKQIQLADNKTRLLGGGLKIITKDIVVR